MKHSVLADTTELKRLIAKYPDYPIVVLCGEDAYCGDYRWMYASDVRFGVGEILDCDQPVDDYQIFYDKDDFYEKLEEWLWDYLCDKEKPTEEEFQKVLAAEKEKYEPYWKNCILIYADIASRLRFVNSLMTLP